MLFQTVHIRSKLNEAFRTYNRKTEISGGPRQFLAISGSGVKNRSHHIIAENFTNKIPYRMDQKRSKSVEFSQSYDTKRIFVVFRPLNMFEHVQI